MFGYIRTVPSELRLREHECYRAYYCGLCRAMGTCTGNCSRMTLSYDFVFLAIARAALAQEAPQTERFRCALHPFKRRLRVVHSEQANFCADASVLLSYHKCADDIADERGWRRLRARFAKLALHSGCKRAQKRHPQLDESIRRSLGELADYEKRTDTHSADEPAGKFGDLMAAVFSEGLCGSAARLAADFGYRIGKWIYLVDAADDFDEDIKRGRYNPYRALFGDTLTDENRRAIALSLTELLMDADRAFQLFGTPSCAEHREILSNVLYLGMPRAAKRALLPKTERKHSPHLKNPPEGDAI